jgi:hypothetical protein
VIAVIAGATLGAVHGRRGVRRVDAMAPKLGRFTIFQFRPVAGHRRHLDGGAGDGAMAGFAASRMSGSSGAGASSPPFGASSGAGELLKGRSPRPLRRRTRWRVPPQPRP